MCIRDSCQYCRLEYGNTFELCPYRAGRTQHAVAHQELIQHIPVAAEQIRAGVIPLHQWPHEILQMTGPGVPHSARVSCAQRIFLY